MYKVVEKSTGKTLVTYENKKDAIQETLNAIILQGTKFQLLDGADNDITPTEEQISKYHNNPKSINEIVIEYEE